MSSTLTPIKSKRFLDLPKYALDIESLYLFYIYFEIDVVDVEFRDAHFVFANMYGSLG